MQRLENSTMDNTTFLCHQAGEMVSSTSFQIVLCLEVVESVVASIFNVLLMSTIWRVSVFHANLRLLLFHHSLNLAMFSLGMGVKAAYFLAVWAMDDPCRLVTSMYACKLQDSVVIVPLVNGVYSLVALCLERAYATIRYTSYDRAMAAPWLACILIPCVWLIVTSNQFLPLRFIPKGKMMPVCANLLSMSPTVAGTILVQNMIVEYCAVILAITLYVMNKRLLENSSINRAKHTLGARFQIFQNVEVNRLLLPTILAHAICFVCVYVYLLLVLIGLDLDGGTKLLLLHINYAVLLTYAIVHPILAFLKNPHLKKICHLWGMGWHLKGQKIDKLPLRQNTAAVANQHFQSLEEMWNVQPSGKEKRR